MASRYHCSVMQQGPDIVHAYGRFRIDGTNSPDRTVDGVPNVKQTVVTRTGAGTFTVQLPKVGAGYPQEMLSCIAQAAYIDATDAGVDEVNEVRYVVDSYNKATGTFTLINVVVTGSVSTAVGDPNDNSEVQFQAVLRNVGILAQTF